ncbi:TonB family protein [Sodalis ligni]|uniref:energy transducer TonB family protein n=1 Tax=Sodalis ligni TaxID=2697027 RepID=UPI00193F25C2|nr:energy transducer TonB [Sodalis ligni]QWA10734.1 TonB family protein [Sodalis ligni]
MSFHLAQSSEPGQAGPSANGSGNGRQRATRVAAWALAVAAAGGLAWLVWQWAHDMSGVTRQVPKIPMIIPLPPPPPPPPPPKEKPPEPEKQVEPKPEPELKPTEQPKPQQKAPTPADDLAKPMQMNSDAQAGNDAFNIGAGSGGGMSGSGGGGGLGNATYGQYLSQAFQRALSLDESIRLLSYRMEVNVWLNEAGQVTRAELVKSSGDGDTDAKVIAALRRVAALEYKPPKSLSLPVRMSLQGRRPN